MKNLKIIALATLLCCCFSCIQKERPNSEADILECKVPEGIEVTSLTISNDAVEIRVTKLTNLSAIAPEFKLTPGATIAPQSGITRDFSFPQDYIVTSEDGEWKKKYTVSFINSDISTKYSFEDSKIRNKYYVFIEQTNGNVTMEWASGNSGFALTGAGKNAEDFPTMQSDEGYKGKCLKLTTRNTGSWGAGMGMPIAAGNLFIGSFDVLSALQSPLKATKFGLPFYNIPVAFTGYYKYKAGPVYSDKGKPVEGKKDSCNIFAMFYETDDNLKSLDGTNMLTHPNIYSIALIKKQKETDEWIYFEIPFEAKPGKTIDSEKLKAGKYNIALVFTSSIEGDEFSGAVGSTLYIDEVELLYNKIN